jgi:hypothetical protein
MFSISMNRRQTGRRDARAQNPLKNTVADPPGTAFDTYQTGVSRIARAKSSVFADNRRNKYWAMNRALVLLPALQAPANSGAPASRIDFACD